MPLRQRLDITQKGLKGRQTFGEMQNRLNDNEVLSEKNNSTIAEQIQQGSSLAKRNATRTQDLQTQQSTLDSKRRLRSVGAHDEIKDIEENPVDDRNGLEKALNLTPNQNFVFDLFEIVERPLKGITSAIKGGEDGDKDIFSGFMGGLSGEDKVSWSEAFNIDENSPSWLKFGVDIVGDIFLDPLTYITFGKSAVAKQSAKASAKAGKEVLEKTVKNVGQEALEQTVKASTKKTFPIGLRLGNMNVGATGKALDQQIFGLAGRAVQGGVKGGAKSFVSLAELVPNKKFQQSIEGLKEYMDGFATSIKRVKSEVSSKFSRTGNNADAPTGQLRGQKFDEANVVTKEVMNATQHIAVEFDKIGQSIHTMARRGEGKLKNATMEFVNEAGKIQTKTIRDMSKDEIIMGLKRGSMETIEKGGDDVLKSSQDVLKDVTSKQGLILTTNAPKSEQSYKQLKKIIGEDNIKITKSTSGKGSIMTLTEEGKSLLKEHTSSFKSGSKKLEALPTLQDEGKTLKANLKKNKEAIARVKKEGGDVTKLQTQQRKLERQIKSNGKKIDDLKGLQKELNKSENFLHREGTNVKVNQFEKQNLVMNLELAAKNKEFKKPRAVINQIDEIAETSIKTGKSGEEIAQYTQKELPKSPFFSKQEVEVSKGWANLTNEVKQLQTRATATLDEIVMGWGIGADLNTLTKSKNYLKHVINPDELDFYKATSFKKGLNTDFSYVDGMRTPEQMVRKRKWMGSAGDINAVLGKQLFLDDPLISVGMNLQMLPKQFKVSGMIKNGLDSGAIKIMDVGQSFDDIKNLKGNHHLREVPHTNELIKNMDFIKQAAGNKNNIKEIEALTQQLLEGGKVAMDRRLYNEIARYNKLLAPGSKDIKDFLATYNKNVMGKWKKIAMSNPAIHIRNFYSNNERMFLSGMNPVDVVKHKMSSLKQQKRFNKVLPQHYDNIIKKMSGKKWKNASLSKQSNFIYKELELVSKGLGDDWKKVLLLEKKGILGNTAMTGNMYKLVETFDDPEAMNKVFNNLNKKKPAWNPARWADENLAMYSRADERAKIAAFDWGMTPKGQKKLRESGLYKAGLSDEDVSAAFVNKTWFNFSDVTPFEKDVLQNVIPFYTWARKNLQLQTENLLNNARGLNRVVKTTKNWNGMVTEEQNDMDMFAQQDGQLNISPLTNMLPGRDDNNVTTLNAQSTSVSAFDFATNPLTSLHPALKAAIQDSTGVDTFTGQQTDQGFFGALGEQALSPITSKVDMLKNLTNPETKAMDDLNFTREFDKNEQRRRTRQAEDYRLQQLIQQKQQAGVRIPTISELLPKNTLSATRRNRLRSSGFASRRRTRFV